jgi:preprotein translocase subunit SecG
MYIAIIVLIVVLSVLLTLFVLVQNSKGGGLAAGFSSSNQIMGVRKTTDFVEKMTWGLVTAIVVLSIASVGVHSSKPAAINESEIKENFQHEKQTQPGVVAPNFGETPDANKKQQQLPATPAKK